MNKDSFKVKKLEMYQLIVTAVSCIVTLILSPISNAAVQFQEVTLAAGLVVDTGETWGASWGDLNGDDYPDLWIGNHFYPPSIYLNNREGTFRNVASTIFSGNFNPNSDDHGLSLMDFDNDGDEDAIELSGGGAGAGCTASNINPNWNNHLYINADSVLEDHATQLGVDNPRGRSRTPLWFDYDRDGNLDLFNSSYSTGDLCPPSTIFKQTTSGFVQANQETGFNDRDCAYAQLADLSGDKVLDLICYNSSNLNVVYDISVLPFRDLTVELGLKSKISQSSDTAIADFNGDLLPDIFSARRPKLGISKAVQVDDKTVQADFLVVKGNEQGLSFATAGDVALEFGHFENGKDIYIGKSGLHPKSTTPYPYHVRVQLSSSNPQHFGLFDHTPGVDSGIYVGFDSVSGTWQLRVSKSFDPGVPVFIQSSLLLSDLQADGFELGQGSNIRNLLLINRGGWFEDGTQAAGLSTLTQGRSVSAGDFDNDMDIDLYVGSTGAVANIPDILYENQGEGTFVAVPDNGGAVSDRYGRMDSVTVADYNLDGFLDLLVSNGSFPPPVSYHGILQLFLNLGNNNHWLELDLEGVISNRDGIGARVLVTAGGVTQLREQNGGMHVFSQNHKRLHIGLGQNTRIETLEVRWPNGIVQTLKNLPVDQVLRLIEPVKPAVAGAPPYQTGVDEGVYLWKQAGVYQLRVSGAAATHYEVKLVSSLPLLMIASTGLETGVDSWQSGMSGFALTAQVGGGDAEDGVKFQVTPGARVLLAVEREGAPNPRQLHIGPQGLPLSPAGWIVPVAELGVRPAFVIGALGLAIGKGAASGWVEARWGGDRWDHSMQVDLLSSEAIRGVTPKYLEPQDQVMPTASGVRVSGWVNTYQDGVDVEVAPETLVGIGYQQDRLLQPRFVKSGTGDLGMPNAYWLPGTQ